VLQLEAPATVHVHAEARSLEPFAQLQLVRNGEVIHTATPAGSPATAVLDLEVPFQTHGWIAACCHYGLETPYVSMNLSHAAHTSPVYIRFKGQPLQADPAVVDNLVSHLDRMLDWVRHQARCETEPQRSRLAEIFQSARTRLLQRRANSPLG